MGDDNGRDQLERLMVLRAQDLTQFAEQLRLALQRRDYKLARHWIQRMETGVHAVAGPLAQVVALAADQPAEAGGEVVTKNEFGYTGEFSIEVDEDPSQPVDAGGEG